MRQLESVLSIKYEHDVDLRFLLTKHEMHNE